MEEAGDVGLRWREVKGKVALDAAVACLYSV